MHRSKIIVAGLILFSSSILSVGVIAIFGFPLVDQTEMEQPSAETEPTLESPPSNSTPTATATPTQTPTPRPTPTPWPIDWPTKENPCKPMPEDVPTVAENSMEAEGIQWRIDHDGDGLSDYCEETVTNTSSSAWDTDDDGLIDLREHHNTTTSPTNGDMDNDGIPDGVEVTGTHADTEIDGLDPHSADLVLVVYPSWFEDPEAISNETIAQMEKEWADLAIQNPDGSTGVDLHVIRKEHRLRIDWDDISEVKQKDPHRDVDGIITVSIVDLDNTQRYGHVVTSSAIRIDSVKNKKFTLTHEALHILVGGLPSHLQGGNYQKTFHMYEGYLSTDVIGTQDYFPNRLVTYMNDTIYAPASR